MKNQKPLGIKNYGSIPHLIGSKLGPADRHVHEGQHKICTERTRDKHDLIIVQEKYDGSNVGIAKKDGKILALTRSGYLACTSPYMQHHIFSKWVYQERKTFDNLLEEGERLVGEWMYQAHGTKYCLNTYPFIAFDLFDCNNQRLPYIDFLGRIGGYFLPPPKTIWEKYEPISIDRALQIVFTNSRYLINAESKPEGVVYRVERKGKVDFLAKFVRHDFEPGIYLSEISGKPPVFNTDPSRFLKA